MVPYFVSYHGLLHKALRPVLTIGFADFLVAGKAVNEEKVQAR